MRIPADQIVLDKGKHQTPEDGVCIQELVCIASGQTTFSDLPACTADVVSRVAQRMWDSADPEDYRRLVRTFLPRLIRARKLDMDANRRIALWAAREVEHLDPTGRAKACNDTHERYLADEVTMENLHAAATTANNAAYTTDAAYTASSAAAAACAACAAAYAAYANNNADTAAYAAYAAAADAAYTTDAAKEDFLDRLLTQWEKEMAATPEGLWVPTEWEQAALDYIDQLCENETPIGSD